MSELTFSPWDARYKNLIPESLSEEALLEAQVDVELSWLLTLMKAGVIKKHPEAKLKNALKGLKAKEIEKIEAVTRHATRALVEAISNRLKKAGLKECAEWVHVGLTSFDTVDSAARVRLKKYFKDDFFPTWDSFIETLEKLSVKHEDSLQVGRTHGQYAVPTVFGLYLGELAYRLRDLRPNIEQALDGLCGQASGAIGGYHAPSLLSDNALQLESDHLERLGLRAHFGSNQIIAPEDIFRLSSEIFSAGSVVTKLANDLRHLARSEISEIQEGMAKGQVGSSTMPQKRNPWNLEHVCSLHKLLQSRFMLLADDLVTEHQRDLTNSASGRFYSEIFLIFHLMILRLQKVITNIEVNTDNMMSNLEHAGSSVFAEAFYVLACKRGFKNAHDIVRESSRESEKTGQTLIEVLKKKKVLHKDENLAELSKMILAGSYQKLSAIKSERMSEKKNKVQKKQKTTKSKRKS